MPRWVALLVGVVLLGGGLPAGAAPPETVEEPWFYAWYDPFQELAVFWNISQEGFCTWVASGFDGPPPVAESLSVRSHESRDGVIIRSFRATRPIELWQLDEGADPSEGCDAMLGQDGPWATGTARVEQNDNDFDVSLTRTNVWGERGQGSVQDADGGTWRYSWVWRVQIDRNDAFHVRVDTSQLSRIGRR